MLHNPEPSMPSRYSNPHPYPVSVPCPHCGNEGAKLFPTDGDRANYRCPSPECGDFTISETRIIYFEEGVADPQQARFVEKNDGQRYLEDDRPPALLRG